MNGVIYSLSFPAGSRIYVGSAWNLRRRMNAHRDRLRRGKHHSPHLQHAANKHGLESMVVTVLEEVPSRSELVAREQVWMDRNEGKLYNASLVAKSRLGMKMPESAKAAISASLAGNQYRVGVPHDEATKNRIRDSLKLAYATGRHKRVSQPQNLTAFNKAVQRGEKVHPSRNPQKDAEIVAFHAETRSLKRTGEKFNLTPCAIWCVVKRCNASQLRRWGENRK